MRKRGKQAGNKRPRKARAVRAARVASVRRRLGKFDEELLTQALAQIVPTEDGHAALDAFRQSASVADLFSRLARCRRITERIAARPTAYKPDSISAVNQELMYCEAELAMRGVWPYREQSANMRRSAEQRTTNSANAKQPRRRKLPTSAEMHAELAAIQAEQGATLEEAHKILQARYRNATPQAINAKLRQRSDR
jgi:hypothetical protein